MRQLVALVVRTGMSTFEHGAQARLARRFGVSRATISRDLRRCGLYRSWKHPVWQEWDTSAKGEGSE